jgi:peptidyl-prolyl cis-trans isomerase SurA
MKKLASILILLAVILSFYPAGTFAAVMLDRVVAIVNNESITWSELYSAMEFELSKKDDRLADEQKMEIFKESEAAFLEEMIDTKVQLQEAERKRIKVNNEDVDRAISTVRNKYSLDEETFYKALEEEGFTIKEYRKMLSEQILIGRLVEREVKDKIYVTEEDVKRYMKGKNLQSEREYFVRQIFFRKTGADSGQDLEKKISRAVEKLDSGERFEDIANMLSEGPAAEKGGDLGYIKEDHLSDEFAAVLANMSIGDFSRPFRTDKGMHIVKLEDVRDIRNTLRDELFEKERRAWLRRLRENSFVEIRL